MSELARDLRSEARVVLAVFPTWGEKKDNDDSYGDDVEVMLLQLRLSSCT